jgi:hypothetical protein
VDDTDDDGVGLALALALTLGDGVEDADDDGVGLALALALTLTLGDEVEDADDDGVGERDDDDDGDAEADADAEGVGDGTTTPQSASMLDTCWSMRHVTDVCGREKMPLGQPVAAVKPSSTGSDVPRMSSSGTGRIAHTGPYVSGQAPDAPSSVIS